MAPASMPLIPLQDALPAYGLEQWLECAGRLHPLVLHLPIGLLAAVVLADRTPALDPADTAPPGKRFRYRQRSC